MLTFLSRTNSKAKSQADLTKTATAVDKAASTPALATKGRASESAPRVSLQVEVSSVATVSPNPSVPSALPPTTEESSSVADNHEQPDSETHSPLSPTNDIKFASPPASPPPRRFSLQRIGALLSPTHAHEKHHDKRTGSLSTTEDASKRAEAKAAAEYARIAHAKLSASDKKAKHSALVVRALIIGPDGIVPGPSSASAGMKGKGDAKLGPGGAAKAKPIVSRAEMNKVKAQLLEPKSANKVILQLKSLPGAQSSSPPNSSDSMEGRKVDGEKVEEQVHPGLPIHAVCFDGTDKDIEEKHFSRLHSEEEAALAAAAGVGIGVGLASFKLPSVTNASVESLMSTLRDIHLVSLLTAPDLGLGQPGDGREGEGILAGALPTAEAVINGVVQITPQLMSLGYATGKAIIPDHKGVYPPTDRMSVLTYWWGLELVLPPPSLAYLSNAQSTSHTVMNFLTALGMVYNGVREILPFARYISQYLEFEFSAIKGQDRGRGVVCAATWIMPAAMVPRPWDFSDPPPKPTPTSPPTTTAPNADIPDTTIGPPSAPRASQPTPSQPPVLPPISLSPDSPSSTPPSPSIPTPASGSGSGADGMLTPPPLAPSTPPAAEVDEGVGTDDVGETMVASTSAVSAGSGSVVIKVVPPTLPRGTERPVLDEEEGATGELEDGKLKPE